jgi:hypothetical protein
LDGLQGVSNLEADCLVGESILSATRPQQARRYMRFETLNSDFSFDVLLMPTKALSEAPNEDSIIGQRRLNEAAPADCSTYQI